MLEKQDKKITNIEKMLTKKNISPNSKTDTVKSKTTKYTGLAGALVDLIDESFFNTPKNLQEIFDQLKANAVFYPKTNYPDALLRLVKHKKLRRLKENKKWVYVKNE